MQELSLWGALPSRKLNSFLQALQHLSAGPATPYTAFTLVFIDGTASDAPQSRRPSNFVRVGHRTPSSPHVHSEGVAKSSDQTEWSIELVEAPEMSKRPVTSRIIHRAHHHSGAIHSLVSDMMYVPAFASCEEGHELLIGNAVIRIYQVYEASSTTTSTTTATSSTMDTMTEMGQSRDCVGQIGFTKQGMIGPSTTWTVQASVSVKAGQTDQVKRAVSELIRLKHTLTGYVDLDVILDELR